MSAEREKRARSVISPEGKGEGPRRARGEEGECESVPIENRDASRRGTIDVRRKRAPDARDGRVLL